MAGTATEEFGVGRSLAESRSSEHVENGSPLIEGRLWNTETRRISRKSAVDARYMRFCIGRWTIDGLQNLYYEDLTTKIRMWNLAGYKCYDAIFQGERQYYEQIFSGGLVGMAGTATEEFGVGRSLAESRSSEHVENGSPLIEGRLWNTETRRISRKSAVDARYMRFCIGRWTIDGLQNLYYEDLTTKIRMWNLAGYKCYDAIFQGERQYYEQIFSGK
ncbi:hypothetical protein DCAR_0310429 [Daucus carota subsp. sativus]|uniref:Uncharacterized protein n=1 Tax=Daucus carota subsp. sativus TaxID=79200 RepID=A0A165ZV20_DAUCS|nr:hypothetical protein DCAR_0310429 [Daucus carota subsp. sativus]